VTFLRRRQNRDGGFPLSPGGGSNAQSTAFAVQALVAARVDVDDAASGGDVEMVADEVERRIRDAYPEVRHVFLDPTTATREETLG
jgi:hypothetical protein